MTLLTEMKMFRTFCAILLAFCMSSIGLAQDAPLGTDMQQCLAYNKAFDPNAGPFCAQLADRLLDLASKNTGEIRDRVTLAAASALAVAGAANFVLGTNKTLGAQQIKRATDLFKGLSESSTDTDTRQKAQTTYNALKQHEGSWMPTLAASSPAPTPSSTALTFTDKFAPQTKTTSTSTAKPLPPQAALTPAPMRPSPPAVHEVPLVGDPRPNGGGYDVRFLARDIHDAPVQIVGGDAGVDNSDVGNQNYYVTACYLANNLTDKAISVERYRIDYSSDLDGVLTTKFATVRHSIEAGSLDQPFLNSLIHSRASECLKEINIYGDNISQVVFSVEAVEFSDGSTWHASP